MRPTAANTPGKHHNNGFDFLRLIGAVLVIYGHAFPLTGVSAPGFLGNHIQTIGVKIFFVISGYLITKSWMADPSIVSFTLKRLLRIMPGLTLNVLVVACILGPAVSTLAIEQYFTSPGLLTYFRNLAFFPVYGLPGVFEKNIYPAAVNGSLWSLPVEMLMYVSVPILLRPKAETNLYSTVVAAGLLIVLALSYVRISPMAQPVVVYGTSIGSLLEVAVYFQIGAVYTFFDRGTYARSVFSLLLLLVCARWIDHYVIAEIALMVVLPYFVLSSGTAEWPTLNKLLRGRDYSYGIYLYGFPVQQALMNRFEGMTALSNFLIALALTTVLAAASWHMIEYPMLRLKTRRRSTSRTE